MKGKDFKANVLKALERIPDDMDIVYYEDHYGMLPAEGINIAGSSEPNTMQVFITVDD
jgi:hypothetical protein